MSTVYTTGDKKVYTHLMFFAYLLRCADGTLYAGSTNDLARRVREHNELAAGARYTRARRPVELVYSEPFPAPRAAKQHEAELKKLARAEKLALIASKSRIDFA